MIRRREVEVVPVMRLVPPGRASVVLARMLLAGIALAAVLLAALPWQQSAHGKGRVVAYSPVDRPQNVEAPLDGRIDRWDAQEGDRVKAGQPVVHLADNDPDILVRLAAERDALVARLAAAQARVVAIDTRLDALDDSRTAATAAAGSRIRMSATRLSAAEQALFAAGAAREAAEKNLVRQRSLAEEGLSAQRALELAELDAARARTEEERARAALEGARGDLSAATSDRAKVGTDGAASISDAAAARAVAESEIAAMRAEIARLDVRIARQKTQVVTAPRDGTITRVLGRQGGEMVKSGDPLFQLVPDTTQRAVEMWVDGNDASLVTAGRSVRVVFEGWPAIQFSGWPSASVGTYGGRVAFVDPSDDGKGHFRVMVVPEDPAAWPPSDRLRQGVRASGFVLLSRVSFGYELWRRLNGFPAEWIDDEPHQPHGPSKEKK